MHLCSNMQRTRVKGTMVRQSSSPESEPDFSTLPPVGVNQELESYSNSMMIQHLGQQIERNGGVTKPTDGNEAIGKSGDLQYTPSSPTTSGQMPKLESLQNQPVTFSLPTILGDHDGDGGLLAQCESPDRGFVSGRPRSSKFMRHVLARSRATEETTSIAVQAKTSGEGLYNAKSPDAGYRSQSSEESSKGSKTVRKVNADLAVFLEEVDLESDEDEALESEEAMARILEQDINQISEV